MYQATKLRLPNWRQEVDLSALRQSKIGLEKESLRVGLDGEIAQTPHPSALGSALTHPYITTDFSEALLEFVTPPLADSSDTLAFLADIHRFTYANLGDELLWATSMPCMVASDADVPIAEYGTSNVGQMKRIYRVGLGNRYGRVMQTISGVHFNFSLSSDFWQGLRTAERAEASERDFKDQAYFALVRNFQRIGWLVSYLFGSSPALCKSFLGDREHGLQTLDGGTLYLPYATSLRMSDLGYKNSTQSQLQVDYGSLRGYVESLTRAIETPYSEYARIGIKVNDEYRQLNDNLLQIENEFYSFIRPKQIASSGEKPTIALDRRGVEYVEMRALDVNPYAPFGVSDEQLKLLECLLLHCALSSSDDIAKSEFEDIERAQREVAVRGRDPDLVLRVRGQAASVYEHAKTLLNEMHEMADALDTAHSTDAYTGAIRAQLDAVEGKAELPSAQILRELRERSIPFFRFAMDQSQRHRDTCLAETNAESSEREAMLRREALQSLDEQARIEVSDTLSFDHYLANYLEQTLDARVALAG